MEKILDILTNFGQQHLLNFYDQLPEEQKIELLNELNLIDFSGFTQVYKTYVSGFIEPDGTVKPQLKVDQSKLEPIPREEIEGPACSNEATLNKYRELGREAVSKGKVGALLLAGGQGTRLGVQYPKGMYNIGLPSQKSLFELQAGRILELIKECSSDVRKAKIVWYVMTSGPTMEDTKNFFKANEYFELEKENIVFFEQNTIPSFDFGGKIFLDNKHKVSRSPNGNGGLFEVLHEKGIIEDMKSRGIEYLHVYSVDNALVRVCDPQFIGYCISKGSDAGSKVVEKTQPDECVGIICKVNGVYKVIEYSEIPQDIASLRDGKTGKLLYYTANICDQFFKVDFLDSIKTREPLPYHVAIKKIPHISLNSGELIEPDIPNGIKLEKFIFDVFEWTNKFVVWEVKREEEFSPVKNAIGTARDNPDTAKNALLRAYGLGILKI